MVFHLATWRANSSTRIIGGGTPDDVFKAVILTQGLPELVALESKITLLHFYGMQQAGTLGDQIGDRLEEPGPFAQPIRIHGLGR